MRTNLSIAAVLTAASCSVFSIGYALEDTKVLPQGVRKFTLKLATTSISEKTDGKTEARPLGSPFKRALTFKDLSKQEQHPTKRNLTDGFVKANGFREDESVGEYDADVQVNMNVIAPMFSYGVTNQFSVAVAVPVYNATSTVNAAFNPNEGGQRLVDALADSYSNKVSAARTTGSAINNALDGLNNSLERNGYKPLTDWNATALGDIQFGGKFKMPETGIVTTAVSGGAVAPTGRVDDPDNFIDVGFGDWQWDLFSQFAVDEHLDHGIFFNQYVKYTEQLPGEKEVRMVRDDEQIAVSKEKVRYKLGNKIEAGASAQWESESGPYVGTGYAYTRKFRDVYRAGSSSKTLERETDQYQNTAEFVLGYSTVNDYKRGKSKVPMATFLTYKHMLESKNTPVSHIIQLDSNIYF